MKQLTSILLFLLPALAMAQTFPIAPPKTPINSGTIQLGRKADGLWYERDASGTERPFRIDARSNSVPIFSGITGMQSLSLTDATATSTITVFTPNMAGVFNYIAGDNTTPNDGVINVRTAPVAGAPAGLLYRRQFDGLVNVKWFNVYGDGVHDDYAGIQNCFTYCAIKNLTPFFPDGTYNISQGLFMTLSNASGTMVNGGRRSAGIKGAGLNSVAIRYTGATAATLITVTGTGDDAVQLEGFRLLCSNPNLMNSTGLGLHRVANYNVTKVGVSTMYLGVDFTDAGEGTFSECVISYNKIGGYANVGVHGVAPNGNLFHKCAINSNQYGGIRIVNGCNNVFSNCQLLGNGTVSGPDSLMRAIYLEYIGINGGNAASIENNYIEGNQGGACIEIKFGNGGAANIEKNTFNRLGTQFNTNDIKFSVFNGLSAGDTQKVHIKLNNNTYNGYNNYTPSASNKRVVYTYGTGNYDGYIVEDSDNYSQRVIAPGSVITNCLVERPAYPLANVEFPFVSTDTYTSFTTTVASLSTTVANNTTAIAANTSAIATKLNTSTFTSYTGVQATVDDAQNTKANSLSTSVVSLTSNKLDKVGGTANSLTVTNLSAYGFL
ncbi:right-handed parallel beta-helix repeat-containing protein, partial [Spirosoma sp. BT702]